jgi:hypothetical protein
MQTAIVPFSMRLRRGATDRRRPALGLSVCAAIIALVALAAPANAQTLDLAPPPPAPSLRGPLASQRVAEILRSEIDELEAVRDRHADATPERAVIEARVAFRRLAFELLVRATAEDDVSRGSELRDTLAMQGFRCADGRRRIDLRLEQYLAGTMVRADGTTASIGVRDRDRVRRLLLRFADVAPKAIATTSFADLAQVDGMLATATTPLYDAVAILSDRATSAVDDTERDGDGDDGSGRSEIGTAWPSQLVLVRAGALGGIVRPAIAAGTMDEAEAVALRTPCAAATLERVGERTRAVLAAACAEKESSEAELAALATGARLSAAAMASTLLDTNEKAAVDQTAAAVASGRGSRTLADAQADLLEAANALTKVVGAKGRIDREELDRAILAALVPSRERGVALADEPASLARIVRRMVESVAIAVVARGRGDGEDEASRPPRELRPIARDLERAYERIEAATWRRLPAMLADEDALSNPEQLGLVGAQREALADLDRIARAGRMVDAIAGIRPQAARGVANRVRTMLQWRAQPTRAADGLLAFETLARQISLFAPLPLEAELRAETPELLAMTGGRPRQLAESIDVARADWADAWSIGEGDGPAARRMHLLHRLMRSMESVARGSRSEDRDEAASLSRWGGFHAARAAMAPALVDIGAMLSLAVDAAVARNDALLEQQLGRIERDTPLVQLVGRLTSELAPWLQARPGDALGTLAALRTPPAPDAWGLPLRGRLASIGRFARELDEARRNNRGEDERALLAFLSATAASTLSALGEERSPLPPLPDLNATSDVRDGAGRPRGR